MSQPPAGRRERICKADEAIVSRICAPSSAYHGMVERIQPLRDPSSDGMIFTTSYRNVDFREGCSEPIFHIGRFLALRAANALFPLNVVAAREQRIFTRRGRLYAATYSDFVPDDSGVIERRRETMRGYYRLLRRAGQDAAFAFREAQDRVERGLNPDLPILAARMAQAGACVSHPEANYHVSGTSTVFFEIDSLDVPRCAEAARESDCIPALEAIAALVAFKAAWISGRMGRPDRTEPPSPGAGIGRFYDFTFNALSRNVSSRIRERLYSKGPIEYLKTFADAADLWAEIIRRDLGECARNGVAPLEPTPFREICDSLSILDGRLDD